MSIYVKDKATHGLFFLGGGEGVGCSIKLHFAPLKSIINFFKSNVIAVKFCTKFLQTIELTNYYWFTSRSITYIIFYLSIITLHIRNL